MSVTGPHPWDERVTRESVLAVPWNMLPPKRGCTSLLLHIYVCTCVCTSYETISRPDTSFFFMSSCGAIYIRNKLLTFSETLNKVDATGAAFCTTAVRSVLQPAGTVATCSSTVLSF